jgi:hypothetical protein
VYLSDASSDERRVEVRSLTCCVNRLSSSSTNSIAANITPPPPLPSPWREQQAFVSNTHHTSTPPEHLCWSLDLRNPIPLSPRLALNPRSIFLHMTETSKVLDGKTRVDLDVLARHTRVLGQRNKHIRAVLEISLSSLNSVSNFPNSAQHKDQKEKKREEKRRKEKNSPPS